MSLMEDVLGRVNLRYEDLTSAERDTLTKWLQVLDSNQLTPDTIIDFVRRIRGSLEDELAKSNETPQDWVGVISLFIPFYGLIRKWYQDQNRIQLQARIKNMVLIETFLVSPKKAKEALNAAIAGMVASRK
jgi:hypothetical protein